MRHLLLTIVSLSIALPSLLHAQEQKAAPPPEPAKPPKTLPPDLLYGDRSITQYGELPPSVGELAPVDRRQEVDRIANLGVVLPTAFVAPQGSLQYTNHLIAGHQLAYSPSDSLSLSALLILPPSIVEASPLNSDLFWTLSATWQVWRSRDILVSLMPYALGRNGQRELDTSEQGVGLAAMLDWAIHDRVLLGFGLMAYAPYRVGYDFYDTSGCASRDDFINRRCFVLDQASAWGPPGGRFFLGWAHLAWYAPQQITVKLEVASGLSSGTVLGLEGLIWGRDQDDVQRRRYASRRWAAGPLHGSRVTAHLGMGWTPGAWGGQVGLLFVPGRFGRLDLGDADDSAQVLPMMQIGRSF
jgi:hypothetical protein